MSAADEPSLQDRYAPASTCFGCGPANPDGLRIKSHARGADVVAAWQPDARHEAFTGYLSGGVIGTLLDCHANWAAATHLMHRAGTDRPPATVTADLAIRFEHPAPTDAPVTLHAHVVSADDRRATVDASLEAGGRVCARATATFVAVGPGHPAFGRW